MHNQKVSFMKIIKYETYAIDFKIKCYAFYAYWPNKSSNFSWIIWFLWVKFESSNDFDLDLTSLPCPFPFNPFLGFQLKWMRKGGGREGKKYHEKQKAEIEQ